jgi:predicted deacylase
MTGIKRLFAALITLMLYSLIATPQKPIKVGEITAAPGEKRSGFITVPAGSDSPEVKIPVTVVNGKAEGPVIALIAGVHGYEYPPVLAMTRLAKELDPAHLSGKVIIVHVANIPSFLKRTVYYNPYDWKNFNRVFPGKEKGTSSERIAYQITREVIDQCDYLIDNHCGDGNEDLMQYLYYTETGNPAVDSVSRQLAVNFNLKVIVHETDRTKDVVNSMYVSNTALLRGKPAISIEAGKLGMTDEEDIIAIIRGSYNVLKYLKMVPGNPVILFESVWVEEYKIITSEQEQALYFPILSRGDHVQAGEEVGYLTDYFGNILQKVYSPFDGIILYIIGTPPMSKGEPMVMIGRFGEQAGLK